MRTASDTLQIARILHAGFIFSHGGTQIAFDPIFETPFSRNCYPFPPVQFDLPRVHELKFTAVFISHFHDDHLSLESLNLIDRATPIYIFCIHSELIEYVRELGFTQVQAMELNQKISMGDFTIIPRRALDADVDSIFQIEVAGQKILNVVDSWIDDETLQILAQQAPWDFVMWPFQTMRELEVLSPHRFEKASRKLPPEWREQLQTLNPRFLVPSSCQFQLEPWSWYNQAFFPISYQQFAKEIAEILPKTEIVRMNPGVKLELTPNQIHWLPRLEWTHPMGEQNLDYEYNENLKPPSTGEVATHFPAPTPEQVQEVLSFCHQDLIEKYNKLPPIEEAYFEKTRYWQLRLYASKNKFWTLNYKIENHKIELTKETPNEISWLTELPLIKVLSALHEGEALTSLYIRINDQKFSNEVEKVLKDLELTDDPLVRSLYNNRLGAYQKSQLKKIQSRISP